MHLCHHEEVCVEQERKLWWDGAESCGGVEQKAVVVRGKKVR
jgi:hypothetical protein